MDIQNYNGLVDDNKMKNRALARTNINIEALKRRIKEKYDGPNYNIKEYGDELLLILINYLVQKYYKDYGLLSFSDWIERQYFYVESTDESRNILAAIALDKSRFYLSSSVLESSDMLSGIISYAIDGFENVEKRVLEGLERVKGKEIVKFDAERILTIYQIITVGSCMGYFSVILDELSLQQSDKFMMKYFGHKQFLLKYANGFCRIDMQNGDLIISNRTIKFEIWNNYSVCKGLEYLINVIQDSNFSVLRLETQVGGFMGRSFNVDIDFVEKKARYTSFQQGFSEEENKVIPLTESELKEFVFKLYELNVRNWKKHYKPKQMIMDGTGWSVKLITDKGEFESEGDNAYPRAWNKFCKSIEVLIKEDFQ